MKKVLVLMLVLGVASMASASLIFKVGGSAVADGSTVSPGALSCEMGVPHTSYTIEISTSGGATMSHTSTTFLAGLLFGNGYVGTGATSTWCRISGDNFMSDMGTTGTELFGALGISGTSGTVTITDLELGDGNDSMGFNIPEPMTVALLGLGGLFLRRRK